MPKVTKEDVHTVLGCWLAAYLAWEAKQELIFPGKSKLARCLAGQLLEEAEEQAHEQGRNATLKDILVQARAYTENAAEAFDGNSEERDLGAAFLASALAFDEACIPSLGIGVE